MSGWFLRHPRIARALAFTFFLLVLDIALGTLLFHLGVVVLPSESYYRQADSRFHHSLRENVEYGQARFGPLTYPVRTNSLGCRDRVVREVSPAKRTKGRLLLLGDSFTEGVGCAWEETFSGMLQAGLGEDWEVLNGGVASYSPAFYLCRADDLLFTRGIEVDEVLVFLDMGDIRDVLRFGLDEQRPYSVTWGPTLLDERVKAFIGTHTVLLHALRYGLRVARLAVSPDPEVSVFDAPNGLWADNERVWREVGQPGLEQAARYLDLLAALLKEKGVALTVVVYPYPVQVLRRSREYAQVRYWREWAARGGHRFLDLTPVFLTGPGEQVLKECFLEGDVHWSPAGHRRVADRLLREWKGG